MRTRECSISELDVSFQSLINNLLDGEEPLFCYETKQTGFIGFCRVILVNKSDIIEISDSSKVRFNIMSLNKIVKIAANKDGEMPSIKIYSSREVPDIEFMFETNEILCTFIHRLREAI